MARAINEQDFANPISRKMALGEWGGKELWLDSRGTQKIPIANGGMINPVRYEIKPGTVIYRFASTTDGVEGAMKGGWWLERQELDHLIQYSKINNKSLSFSVRLLCCIPPEWGASLNFLVAVRAAHLIAVWRGFANSAIEDYKLKPGMSKAASGTTRINARNDVAALRVPQLFIPGTKQDGATRALFSYIGQWQTEGAADWIYGSG